MKPKRIAMEQQVKQVPKGMAAEVPALINLTPAPSLSAERAQAAKEPTNTGRLAQAFPGCFLSFGFQRKNKAAFRIPTLKQNPLWFKF